MHVINHFMDAHDKLLQKCQDKCAHSGSTQLAHRGNTKVIHSCAKVRQTTNTKSWPWHMWVKLWPTYWTCHEDVLRLDISVHDSLAVHQCQGALHAVGPPARG